MNRIKPLENIGYLLDDDRAKNLLSKLIHPDKSEFPLAVTRAVLFVTNRCNFKCRYCKSLSHQMRHWATEEIIQLLDALALSGTKHVQWTGGEASLRDDIVELVRYSARHHMNNSMSTNVSLDLNKYISLVDAGLQRFYISLDTLDDHEYDQITASHTSLSSILYNIHELVRYKKQKAFHMTLNVTLDSKRYASLVQNDFLELKSILSWLVDSHVDDFKFLPVQDSNSQQCFTDHDTFSTFLQISRQIVPSEFLMFHHRLNTLMKGGHGFTVEKDHFCYQCLDDRAFDSSGSYGCVIQLREGGKPIYFHDDPYEYKILSLMRFLNSNRYSDPICRSYCFDLYKDLNDRVHYLLKRTTATDIQT